MGRRRRRKIYRNSFFYCCCWAGDVLYVTVTYANNSILSHLGNSVFVINSTKYYAVLQYLSKILGGEGKKSII